MTLKSKFKYYLIFNILILNTICLCAENSFTHINFNYRALNDQKLTYGAVMIDSYQVKAGNGVNNAIVERIESTIYVEYSDNHNNLFNVTVELTKVIVDNKEIIDENNENPKFVMVFNINETGSLVLTADSENSIKSRLNNGDSMMVYFGRSIRAFFLTRFSLPSKESDQGNGTYYEWEADLDFGLNSRNIIFRGLPINGKVNIMGYSNLKKFNDDPIDFSAAPEKISAIFSDGLIIDAEYSANIGDRTMVVKVKLVSVDQDK